MTNRTSKPLNAEYDTDPKERVCRNPDCSMRGKQRRRRVLLPLRGWGWTITYFCDVCETFFVPGQQELEARYPGIAPGSECPKCGGPHLTTEPDECDLPDTGDTTPHRLKPQ